MNESYNSNDYERLTQRFVNPIFIKDEIGNIHFSSTMTFIKYKKEYFSVFAAHALPKGSKNIDKVGVLTIDGHFMGLSDVSKGSEIFWEYDLVIAPAIQTSET